jgi:hypothetical protein
MFKEWGWCDFFDTAAPIFITLCALFQLWIVSYNLFMEHKVEECKVAFSLLGTIDFHLVRLLWIERFDFRGGRLWL